MGKLVKIYGELKNDQPSLAEFKQFLRLLDKQVILATPCKIYWTNRTKTAIISKYADSKVFRQYKEGLLYIFNLQINP